MGTNPQKQIEPAETLFIEIGDVDLLRDQSDCQAGLLQRFKERKDKCHLEKQRLNLRIWCPQNVMFCWLYVGL